VVEGSNYLEASVLELARLASELGALVHQWSAVVLVDLMQLLAEVALRAREVGCGELHFVELPYFQLLWGLHVHYLIVSHHHVVPDVGSSGLVGAFIRLSESFKAGRTCWVQSSKLVSVALGRSTR